MLIEIPNSYLNSLGARDTRSLRTMLKRVISKEDLKEIDLIFDDFTDLLDWIDEYQQEGHIL